jgi:hypothetical protein
MMTATVVALPIAQLQSRFLAIRHRIETHARIYFRQLRSSDEKAERIAETLAIAWKWFVRLAQRGKDATHYPSVLATFAARAVNAGRRLCGQLKAKDVLSERAQQRHGFRVEQLPLSTRTCHDELNGLGGQRHLDAYEERLQDNTRTPPDEQAAFRLDFPAWLTTRTERDRRIINDMVVGEGTNHLARRFGMSPSRVSQLRREYRDDWRLFIGEIQKLPQKRQPACKAAV